MSTNDGAAGARGLDPARSSIWQPAAIAANAAATGDFLRTVAATPMLQAVAARSVELLALRPGDTVLELACGPGVLLPRLASAVGPTGHVIGVDLAPAFVAEAQAAVAAAGLQGRVSVLLGDALKLPLADASVDAAHCERLLIHLEDPDAALREVARVLRPGATLVVAEPDWGALRIDHPDREGFDAIYPRSAAVRHPDMGLTLYRRLRDAGFVNVRACPLLGVMHDWPLVQLYGVNLQRGADAAVASGVLTRERALAVIEGVEAAHRDGRFIAVGPFHIAAGEMPG